MSKKKPAAETSPFAHLIGNAIATFRGQRAQDHEEPDGDEMAEDEEDMTEAEGDEDMTEAEEQWDDEEAEDEPEDKEMRKAYRAGFAAANARARAIFACPAAAGQVVQAATLAFDTRLSAKEAVNVLKANEAAGTRLQAMAAPLATRMGKRQDPRPGAEGGRTAVTLADKMIALGKRAGQIA